MNIHLSEETIDYVLSTNMELSYYNEDKLITYYLLNNNLDGNNFIIAFDDVSSSIKEITPFLFDNKIPFVISPCTGITSNGYGIRDKVYFIIKNI